jgi:hypothetical protein
VIKEVYMKKATKWVFGIVIGMVVLAILASVGFMVFGDWGERGRGATPRQIQPWGEQREMPWKGNPGFGMPMRPCRGMPGGMHGGFGGFSPFGMFFGSLIWLGVLVLIVLGIIAFVRYLKRSPHPAIADVTTASSVPLPPSESVIESSSLTTHPCPKCSRDVQEDWIHCPYCATDLK